MDAALSAAIKEAYASAPSDLVIHDTLEIWNVAMSAPIRVVRDDVALTARIEAGAPRDAGAMVTFAPYRFDLTLPEQITTGVPSATIEIDNVDRVIGAQIDLASKSGTETAVLFRRYLSSNLSVGPENLPVLAMTLLNVTVGAFRVQGTAGFPDLLNRRFPALDYDPEIFKSLVP